MGRTIIMMSASTQTATHASANHDQDEDDDDHKRVMKWNSGSYQLYLMEKMMRLYEV